MRFLHVFLVVLAVVGAGVLLEASPIDDDNYAAYPLTNAAEALLDVDGQGHANEGERLTRQFGFGGYRGGYGGYRGGYGGYRGGYGGYRGGYGGYRGGYGGYRGGYGGYGGYGGGFFG